MKLTDLFFWLALVTVATGSTTEVLDRVESWLKLAPAQAVPAEKKPEAVAAPEPAPAKKETNELRSSW